MIIRRIVGTTLVAASIAVVGAGTAGAATAGPAVASNPVQDFVESLETAVDECSSAMVNTALSGAGVGGMLGAAGGPLGVALGASIGGLAGEIAGGESACDYQVIEGTPVPDPDDMSRGHKGPRRK